MSLTLTKIEVECWEDDDFERFLKDNYKHFESEDLKEWVGSEVYEADYDKTLEQVGSDICTNGGGYNVWTDFQLYYTDAESGTYYTFTFDSDGELVEVDTNGKAISPTPTGKCNPYTTYVRDILTVPSPERFCN